MISGTLTDVSSENPDYAKLGKRVQRRRGSYPQELIQAFGGPSHVTLGPLERGLADSVSPATYAKLDRGLGWEPGSAEAVAFGGEPVERPDWPWEEIKQLRDRVVHGLVEIDSRLERVVAHLALMRERDEAEAARAAAQEGGVAGNRAAQQRALQAARASIMSSLDLLERELTQPQSGSDGDAV